MKKLKQELMIKLRERERGFCVYGLQRVKK